MRSAAYRLPTIARCIHHAKIIWPKYETAMKDEQCVNTLAPIAHAMARVGTSLSAERQSAPMYL